MTVTIYEKDLEDYLYNHPEKVNMVGWFGRQIHVPSGIIDLLGYDDKKYIHVFELKATEIKSEDFAQVCRYAHDIKCLQHTHSCPSLFVNYIFKHIVFVGGVHPQILHESYAMKVMLHSIQSVFEFKMTGSFSFSEEYRQKSKKSMNTLYGIVKDVIQIRNKETFKKFQEVIANTKTIFSEIITEDEWVKYYNLNVADGDIDYYPFSMIDDFINAGWSFQLLDKFKKFYILESQEMDIGMTGVPNFRKFINYFQTIVEMDETT